MRSPALTFATLGVSLLTLAGCASAPDAVSAGNASEAVEVTGAFGERPEVDLPTPLYADETQRTVLIDEEGREAEEGDVVIFDVVMLNGGDASVVQETGYSAGAGSYIVAGAETLAALGTGLVGASAGDRLVIAGSPADSHGGAGIPQANVAAEDSLIFVVDVTDVFPGQAEGDEQVPQGDVPSVVRDPESGQPGITVPSSEPPTELVANDLIRGDGEVVEEGDQVMVHYTGVSWSTGEVFDSSWQNGAPTPFPIQQGSLIDGFVQGLVGRTVGSQVLLVVPPELGYGDAGSGAIAGGETLVFVVDLLGIL